MLIQKPVTLEAVEGKQAIFTFEDGQRLCLDKENLTKGELKVGATFILQLLSEAQAKLNQEDLARSILNQLLSDETSSSDKT